MIPVVATTLRIIRRTGVSNNSDITFGQARSATTTGAFPTTDSFNLGPYFGPSFEAVVPEPTSFLLVGMGAAGMAVSAWRWNKKKAIAVS